MVPKVMQILLVLCVLHSTSAKCPSTDDIPTMFNKHALTCARIFQTANRNPFLSCTGKSRDIPNEEITTIARGWNDKIEALVVMPGCTFMGYEAGRFGMAMKAFTGTYTVMHWWSRKISSWTCNCEYKNKVVDCIPRDYLKVLKTCRNPSSGVMECTHSVSTGMEIGKSSTTGKTVSHTATAEVGVAIKEVFSASLSYSFTTGYDWSHTDSSVFSSTTESIVKCVVEPHKSIKMVTVVGKCGDTEVNTGHYECREEK